MYAAIHQALTKISPDKVIAAKEYPQSINGRTFTLSEIVVRCETAGFAVQKECADTLKPYCTSRLICNATACFDALKAYLATIQLPGGQTLGMPYEEKESQLQYRTSKKEIVLVTATPIMTHVIQDD